MGVEYLGTNRKKGAREGKTYCYVKEGREGKKEGGIE